MTPHRTSIHPKGLVQHYPVAAFFVMAYAFSWAIGSLLIADYHGAFSVPRSLHYLSAFGPAVAALLVTAIIGGRAGLADLWRRIARVDIGVRWWLIGIGTPLVLGLAAVVAYMLTNRALPDLALFGEVDYLGNIGVLAALALWITTYGFGEEIGWRGFAFHRMEASGWVRAAVVIGVLWGVWHLPYFFYKENFIAMGAGGFVFYIVSITMGAILLSWMYQGSGHSISLVALWHGLFDFVSASPVAEGVGNVLISGVVIAWVIAILQRASRAARHRVTATSVEQGGIAP